jgi:hypothetical protein
MQTCNNISIGLTTWRPIIQKAHRGIDFEPLVTEEEVRLVKAWKFH